MSPERANPRKMMRQMTSFFGQKNKDKSSFANEGFMVSKTKKKRKTAPKKRGQMKRRAAINIVDDDPFI